MHKYFGNAGWEGKRVLEGMDHAEDFYMSRAAQVKLPKWTNGRALVLGDAAFAIFGVGSSLAIDSTYVLAGELLKIQSSSDVPQALQQYEEMFRPLYAKMGKKPPFPPQMVFQQTSWGFWLRNSLLWLVSKTKTYKLFQGRSGTDLTLQSYDSVGI